MPWTPLDGAAGKPLTGHREERRSALHRPLEEQPHSPLPRQTIQLVVRQGDRGLVGGHDVQAALQRAPYVGQPRLPAIEVRGRGLDQHLGTRAGKKLLEGGPVILGFTGRPQPPGLRESLQDLPEGQSVGHERRSMRARDDQADLGPKPAALLQPSAVLVQELDKAPSHRAEARQSQFPYLFTRHDPSSAVFT